MKAPPRRPVAGQPVRKGTAQPALHPRNRHQGRYDLKRLVQAYPPLARHLLPTPGGQSVDFADPAAVRALNRALLMADYGIAHWDVPAHYLCPPIPGRADYVHALADLLGEGGAPARGSQVRVLDVGTGANLVYPLIGQAEYGWRFVGSDIDATALEAAAAIVQANGLDQRIQLRRQHEPARVFAGVIGAGEYFAATLCNPPFHASRAEALQGSRRKLRNLAAGRGARPAAGRPVLNFGGQSHELWCPGGEAGLLRRMVAESRDFAGQVGWFTSLVARSEHLPALRAQLGRIGAAEVREVAMAQGNKRSRFLAWSFQDAAGRLGPAADAG
jgi:23S rRNA (adenine1618-N6)-methyltransferase